MERRNPSGSVRSGPAGCKVTVENRKGVDIVIAIAALRETIAQLESQLRGEAA